MALPNMALESSPAVRALRRHVGHTGHFLWSRGQDREEWKADLHSQVEDTQCTVYEKITMYSLSSTLS